MSEPDLRTWQGAQRPRSVVLEGRYARLEPLAAHHAPDLWAAVAEHRDLYRFLHEPPPRDEAAMHDWVDAAMARTDLLMWAVVDRRTDRAGGRQALMRVDSGNGVIELGSVLWGPSVARSRISTEAVALHAGYVFDELGYRRLEWKCDSRNGASDRAARRLGFTYEGRFAQHMVVKGQNRDTDWFAILDRAWPEQHRRFDTWLDPANFTAAGHQRRPLERGSD